ncbi:MAG: hypothetical protein [Bacteriophage sp.]|nr:MAG: hypothetical protein [Bacteriophage sp.]
MTTLKSLINNIINRMIFFIEDYPELFSYCFTTLVSIALYFIFDLIFGVPNISGRTIIYMFVFLAVTSGIAICLNMWFSHRFSILAADINPDWRKKVLWYFDEKRDYIENAFLVRCVLAGIAISLAGTNYQIIIFNVDTEQSAITIDLVHLVRLFCFVTVIYLAQLTIRNFSSIRGLSRLNREIKEAIEKATK